jgi:hypothetical protein
MINEENNQIDGNIEDYGVHDVSSDIPVSKVELNEEILIKMGFDYGDIEMLEMLKDIEPKKCNMDTIKQNYMDILQGRTSESNIVFDVIVGSEGDTIFGTDILKKSIANDVLTLLVNEINNPVGGKVKRKRRGKTIKKNSIMRKKRRTKKRRFSLS